jgi:translation initiation factor IF-3
VRVLTEAGEMLGELSLTDALAKSHELQVDLVEIAPNAKPPVAKLIDFNKFMYQQKKKKKLGKPVRSGDIKEMWLTPFIADHDLSARIERGKELLKENGKLRIVVRFRRPQMSRRQFGEQVMQRFITGLEEAVIEKPPKFEGMRLIASVSKK